MHALYTYGSALYTPCTALSPLDAQEQLAHEEAPAWVRTGAVSMKRKQGVYAAAVNWATSLSNILIWLSISR